VGRDAKTGTAGAVGAVDRSSAAPGWLSVANVASYLEERGLLPEGAEAYARELSGGISNTVLRVEWAGDAVVVKQSLPLLRVEEVWEFDRRRILAECDCMRVLGDVVPTGQVPEVLDVDEHRLAFTMTCAPPGGVVWKDALLRGAVDLTVARRAGAMLAAIHRTSAADPAFAVRFGDLMPLIEGRIDPYHRTAALAHPDLAWFIDADADRLLTHRRALVLGDYAPKNLIVYPDRVLALDFEVAHWGDPAFDTAFMLTHLLAKAVHLPDHGQELVAAAREFWTSYHAEAGAAGADPDDTATECGVLLLCRVDAKSKLEYLTSEEREVIRRLARALVRRGSQHLAWLFDTVAGAVTARSGHAGARE
jgi:aminoglycoside phosphotransferase (APT) family kinase protein